MDWLINAGKFLATNWQIILNALVGILSAVIAIALLIPGEQPEKALQAIVDFLSKFSKKDDSAK